LYLIKELEKDIINRKIISLKLTKLKLAILVNFNVDNIKSGIFRKVNEL
jgi:hypothetical protein